MKYVVDFYKSLDTVNLIIFWGVIIVLLLLIIFSTILAHKNKQDDELLEEELEKEAQETNEEEYGTHKKNNKTRAIDLDDDYDELAIKTDGSDNYIDDSNEYVSDEVANYIEEDMVMPKIDNDEIANEPKRHIEEDVSFTKIDIPIVEKTENNAFVAEEHVKDYNRDFFNLPNIEKNEVKEESIIEEKPKNIVSEKEESLKKEVNLPTGAYQRNVLRKVYPAQTSPIGITSRPSVKEDDITKAIELNKVLNEDKINSKVRESSQENENRRREYNNRQEIERKIPVENYHSMSKVDNIPVTNYSSTVKRGNYLEELSKKMAQNTSEEINRTKYELKQEEDAIISYKELMQKKDSIKTIDEEDAVISIEELTRRKREEERVYNITEKENDDEFINALKNFRSDL